MPINNSKYYNLPACRDIRGVNCFACEKVKADTNYRMLCTALADTRKTPCPFYKSKEQYKEEAKKKEY